MGTQRWFRQMVLWAAPFWMFTSATALIPLCAQAPAKARICFLYWPQENQQFVQKLVTMDTDGRNWREIVDAGRGVHDLCWSPSGIEIAYQTGNSIVIVDVGSGAVREFFGAGSNGLDWSPDGSTFVISSGPGEDDSYDLYTIRADGSDRSKLTNVEAGLRWQKWSPDGAHIACSADGERGVYGLFIADALDGSVRQISDQHDRKPAWSADGSRLAFVRYDDPVQQRDGTIWTIALDGSNELELTHVPLDVVCLTWSPDGRQIAYCAGAFPFGQNIYVMRSDGSDIRRITGNGAAEIMPDWFDPAALSVQPTGTLSTIWGALKLPPTEF